MVVLLSSAYLLPVAIQELFPKAEILHVDATDLCFFCDLTFDGYFETSILHLLEDRMKNWIRQDALYQCHEMIVSNALQFLHYHGQKKLADEISGEDSPVCLLQLDRFFFHLPYPHKLHSTGEYPWVKLVAFFSTNTGIRIIGTAAKSKEEMKKQVQKLKNSFYLQQKLEELKLVSWIGNDMVIEKNTLHIQDCLKKFILGLYQGFDYITIPSTVKKKPFFINWKEKRHSPGVLFEQISQLHPCYEPWDLPVCHQDISWGRCQDIKSFLHIIAQFLKILQFEYEVVCAGVLAPEIEEVISSQFSSWKKVKGKSRRLDFFVYDHLRRKWLMSFVEWDVKKDLLQMTLCASLERCIALMIERMTIETVLNRLKLL